MMCAAGHQIVTGPFWRGARQNRSLDVQETVFIKIVANGIADLGAKAQTVRHLGATQIDVAMTQTDVFSHFGMLIQHERRRSGRVENLELLAQNLDAAGAHHSIAGALRTQTDDAGDLQHIFAANSFRQGETLSGIRIEYDLSNAFAIAQVYEDHAAMVTTTVGPAAQNHFLSDVLFVQ